MSNFSSNSRRRVRALIESRPKAESSVSRGTSCPSGTRTRYLLTMVSNCTSITRCTSLVAGILLLGTWSVGLTTGKWWEPGRGPHPGGGTHVASASGSRIVADCCPPLECQRPNLAPEVRCQQSLFDRFRGFGRMEGMGGLDVRHPSAMAHCVRLPTRRRPSRVHPSFTLWTREVTHLSITRRTGPYQSVWKVGRLFNHICGRTSRAPHRVANRPIRDQIDSKITDMVPQ
jgi:hypothetical protein